MKLATTDERSTALVVDDLALLVLVALLDRPFHWWTASKLGRALRRHTDTIRKRIEALVRCGLVEPLHFHPMEMGRTGQCYWVAPGGLRAARAMIRANAETLLVAAVPVGLSVRNALGFGPLSAMLETCRCSCGRCCCGLTSSAPPPARRRCR